MIYTSREAGYDRVIVSESRDAAAYFADLAVGEWSDWQLRGFEIDGAEMEGHVACKLVTLSAEADNFELFSHRFGRD